MDSLDPWVDRVDDTRYVSCRSVGFHDEIELSGDRLIFRYRVESDISVLHFSEDLFIVSLEVESSLRKSERGRDARVEFAECDDSRISLHVCTRDARMEECMASTSMHWRDESYSTFEVGLECLPELFERASDEDSGDLLILVVWLYRDVFEESVTETFCTIFRVHFPDFEESEMTRILQIFTCCHEKSRRERSSHVGVFFIERILYTDSIVHVCESDLAIE